MQVNMCDMSEFRTKKPKQRDVSFCFAAVHITIHGFKHINRRVRAYTLTLCCSRWNDNNYDTCMDNAFIQSSCLYLALLFSLRFFLLLLLTHGTASNSSIEKQNLRCDDGLYLNVIIRIYNCQPYTTVIKNNLSRLEAILEKVTYLFMMWVVPLPMLLMHEYRRAQTIHAQMLLFYKTFITHMIPHRHFTCITHSHI